MSLDAFMDLSCQLLGDPELPHAFGAALYRELSLLHDDALERLLASGRLDEIVADAALRATAADVAQSWLHGAPFKDGEAKASQGDAAALWFEGRFWLYARAHVPALPGGYFGHWMYSGEER